MTASATIAEPHDSRGPTQSWMATDVTNEALGTPGPREFIVLVAFVQCVGT